MFGTDALLSLEAHPGLCGLWLHEGAYEGIVSINCPLVLYFTNEFTKYRQSPGKHFINTVHIDDVVRALWAAANWMAGLGRQQADATAGEPIHFRNDKKKIKDIEGIVSPDQTPVAPLFNLARRFSLSLSCVLMFVLG
jgi:hypothetical protein